MLKIKGDFFFPGRNYFFLDECFSRLPSGVSSGCYRLLALLNLSRAIGKYHRFVFTLFRSATGEDPSSRLRKLFDMKCVLISILEKLSCELPWKLSMHLFISCQQVWHDYTTYSCSHGDGKSDVRHHCRTLRKSFYVAAMLNVLCCSTLWSIQVNFITYWEFGEVGISSLCWS